MANHTHQWRGIMRDLEGFLNENGGLHDVQVQRIIWDSREGSCRLGFDDIYSNFLGLPEYKGPKKGYIQLHSVRSVELDMKINLTVDKLNIYEIALEEIEAGGINLTGYVSGNPIMYSDAVGF